MKKLFGLFLLMLGFVLVGCNKDNEPEAPFQWVADSIEELSGNTLSVAGYEDLSFTLPLTGAKGDVTAEVAGAGKDWVDAKAIRENNNWKIDLTIRGYGENKKREAVLAIKSAGEMLELTISQQGAPVPGQLKFAAEQQPEGFENGKLTLSALYPKTVDVAVTGITEGLTVEVRGEDTSWLTAEAFEAEGKVALGIDRYRGEENRIGYVTLKSGIDELLLQVICTKASEDTEMVVVCEGQYGYGTGALSVIRYDGSFETDIFRKVNDNKPLGDVAQSIAYLNDKYFVVLNNSKQIKVVDPLTFKWEGTINYDQPGAPRFIVRLNDTEALVSDNVHAQLVKINYKEYKIVEHIPVSATIERMTRVGNKIFCAAGVNVWMYDADRFDAKNPTVIPVEGIMSMADMLEDENGKLWVMGTAKGGKNLKLYCVDPVAGKIDEDASFEIAVQQEGDAGYEEGAITGFPGSWVNRMAMDRTKSKLYFVLDVWHGENKSEKAVYTFDVATRKLEHKTFIPDVVTMYGMGISPDGEVYICDCMGYSITESYIRHYKNDKLVDNKKAGLFPSMIHFTEYNR